MRDNPLMFLITDIGSQTVDMSYDPSVSLGFFVVGCTLKVSIVNSNLSMFASFWLVDSEL